MSNIFMALFPFKNPTVSDIEYFGGIDSTRWIWSSCTFPYIISIPLHSVSCFIISRTDLPISPFSILNRYLGHHTTWYLHCHTACANFLNCFIEYLLQIFRVSTNPFSWRYSFLSLTYLHSIAWTISLADGLVC